MFCSEKKGVIGGLGHSRVVQDSIRVRYVPSAASGLAVRLTALTVPSLITTSTKDC